MKNMKIALTLICFLIALNVTAQDQTIIIKTHAQCDECKEKIEKKLNYLIGVKSANLDVKSKEVTVVYNSEKTNPDKIRFAITKVGYDADSIPADPKAYARLKPCCTKDGHKH